MATLLEALNFAIEKHQSGNLQVAEQIYRQILEVDPAIAEPWHLLGLIAHQMGVRIKAIEYIERAIQLRDDVANYHLNLGNVWLDEGKLAAAVASYQRAISLEPNHAEALNNLGHAYRLSGKLANAMECFQRSLMINPDIAATYNNLGNLYSDQQQYGAAIDCYRKVLVLQPNHAECLNNLGVALKHQSKVVEAEIAFKQALQLNPNYAAAYNNLATVYREQEKIADAIACAQQAIQLQPSFADAHYNLGDCLLARRQYLQAMDCFQRAITLNPQHYNAYNNLGVAFHELGRFSEAIASYRQALQINPSDAEILNNIGSSYDYQGDYVQAAASFRQSREWNPNNVEVYNNLGIMHYHQGDYEKAVACYQRVISQQPTHASARYNQAIVTLLRGNLPQGWREYEWRWLSKSLQHDLPLRLEPIWSGESLAGKTLLVQAEQGLGDSFQFIRYVEPLKLSGANILFAGPAALMKILRSNSHIDHLVTENDLTSQSFDYAISLLSLPALFETELTTIPTSIPYLFADPRLIEQWRTRLAALPGFRIGINWHGREKNGPWQSRNIPLNEFSRLQSIPNIQLISLQKSTKIANELLLMKQLQIHSFADELDTTAGPFMDTAAIMKNLDLVITCDTSIAHLAGALGVPVWVALPYVPDWRWLLNREDSPWYPTMRLFRQTKRGEWGDVFERMAAALNKNVV